jgi:hypothetical protein
VTVGEFVNQISLTFYRGIYSSGVYSTYTQEMSRDISVGKVSDCTLNDRGQFLSGACIPLVVKGSRTHSASCIFGVGGKATRT